MAYLLAKDTVNGAEGKIFITVDGKNIEVACMKNITTNGEIQGNDMRVIGTRKIQNKANGAKLTGTGNIYYGTNLFTDMVLKYINEGIMTQFDIQITNRDPSTTIGSQTIAYYGCQLTGTIPLSILNDEESMLNYDFNFTYTNVARLTAFNDPAELGSDN
ncbi:MAG: phage tail tube protein [Eubacteriales bacterium]|nr:phage tail tube protein [Eubacteriales bacterium]